MTDIDLPARAAGPRPARRAWAGLALLLALLCQACAGTSLTGREVARITSLDGSTNAYVVHDRWHAIVIDSLRGSADAARIVDYLRARDLGLRTVTVTHGHPDHFLGLAALMDAYPEARIVVASQGIKDDIARFAAMMTEQGWLNTEPAMKPRAPSHPDGFPYGELIEVAEEPELSLGFGLTLTIEADYPPGESPHAATYHSPALNALFVGDLAYHDAHLWLGSSVRRGRDIANWRATLQALEEAHAAPAPTVYPGHGAPATPDLFAANRAYLDRFLAIIDAAPSEEEAITALRAAFPGYLLADTVLPPSVGHQLQQRPQDQARR